MTDFNVLEAKYFNFIPFLGKTGNQTSFVATTMVLFSVLDFYAEHELGSSGKVWAPNK